MRSGNPWKLKSSKIVYQNPWIKIQEDQVVTPTGKDGMYAYLISNDSVMIAVLNNKNELFMVRTFSYPSASWNWELPGGGGDKQHPLEASKRELEEETGIIAKQWVDLGSVRVCNGFMTERMAIYVATDISFDGQKEVADEQIDEGRFISMDEVDAMIDRGEVNDGQSITAIHLAQKWLDRFGKNAPKQQ